MFPIKNKDTENFHFTTSFLLNIEIFRRRTRNPHIVILTLCILLTRRIAYFRPKGGVAEKNAAISAIFQIIFLNANRMHRKFNISKTPEKCGKTAFPGAKEAIAYIPPTDDPMPTCCGQVGSRLRTD